MSLAPVPALLGRDARIDRLRGIAIVLVLLLHFTLAYGADSSPLRALLGTRAAHALLYNGNYGVTIFFVVSGYLITARSLVRWGQLGDLRVASFYRMRVARIAPGLLVALALIVSLGCLHVRYFANTDGDHHLPSSFFVIAVLSVLTFWHNVLMQHLGWFNYCLNIYWSLSVEEVFYLAMPLACVVLRRTPLLVALCFGLILYGPIYRSMHIDNELFFECGYAACFDAIAFGCLVALAARRWAPRGRAARLARIAALATMAVAYLRGIDGHEVGGFSLVAAGAALYLFAAVNERRPPGRFGIPLQWAGRHSYELYLFHIIVLALMRNVLARDAWGPLGWTLALMAFIVLSSALAALIARTVMAPANAALRGRQALAPVPDATG